MKTADRLVEETIALYGETSVDGLEGRMCAVSMRISRGLFDEALSLVDRLIEDCKRALGERHFLTLCAHAKRATAMHGRGDMEAFQALCEWTVEQRVDGDDHEEEWFVECARLRMLYGFLIEDNDAAIAYLEKLRQSACSRLGFTHETSLEAAVHVGRVLIREKNYKEAGRLFAELHRVHYARLAEDPKSLSSVSGVITALGGLAIAREHADCPLEAITLLEESARLTLRVYGEDHVATVQAHDALVRALMRNHFVDRCIAVASAALHFPAAKIKGRSLLLLTESDLEKYRRVSATYARCAACARQKIPRAMARCAACARDGSATWYCNRECQRADWRRHKKMCTTTT